MFLRFYSNAQVKVSVWLLEQVDSFNAIYVEIIYWLTDWILSLCSRQNFHISHDSLASSLSASLATMITEDEEDDESDVKSESSDCAGIKAFTRTRIPSPVLKLDTAHY